MIKCAKFSIIRHAAFKLRTLIFAALLLALSFSHAWAQCSPPTACCAPVFLAHVETQRIVTEEHTNFRVDNFGTTFGIPGFRDPLTVPSGFYRLRHYENFITLTLFEQHILPMFMMMTEQLVAVGMEQMLIVGTFLDARQQLKTQLLMQELAAQAHKDYHPSFEMCEIGTVTRSLAAAEFNSDLTKHALNKQFLDRQQGAGASVGSGGPSYDIFTETATPVPTPYNRLGYFLTRTCDIRDLNKDPSNAQTGLEPFCDGNPTTQGWVNRDIDWNNTVMNPRTINVDYTTDFAESASDNQRLFQFSNYLYGHSVFPRVDGSMLNSQKNQDNYLDSRSVTARRSVAQNSFNNIVALKTRGTRMPEDPGNPRDYSSEETFQYVKFFMNELGLPYGNDAEYRAYLFQKNEAQEPPGAAEGERDELSYYAQMEILAKKLYQRPEFYTALYDKPANVKRKSAAMQAIKTMLDRDIFESQLRSEAIMSMILELKVVEEQQNIENELSLIGESRSK